MAGKILIIEGSERLRGMLQAHLAARDYQVGVAANGLEAARQVREGGAPDLVLVDQDVPMGGLRTARLLRLHPLCRQVPMVLTLDHRRAVDALVEQGSQVNLHSFLLKPFSGQELEKKVEEGLGQRLGKIDLSVLRAELERLAQLPVLGPNHRRIIDLLNREDAEVDIPQLVRTIEADQGMTTTVLRVCRSAYYGFRGNTIAGAVTFLGVDKLRKIAQAAIVFDLFASEKDREQYGDFSILELWRHSLACGAIMEEGGRLVRGRDHFIAGMLHDIGKVIVHLRFPEYFGEVLRIVDRERKSMYQAERELIGFTHADIGHELVSKWQLPPTICAAIAHHHRPSAALQHKRLASLVHLSDILARTLEIGHGGDRVKIDMDEEARPLARYVFAAAEKKSQIAAQVESMLPQGG